MSTIIKYIIIIFPISLFTTPTYLYYILTYPATPTYSTTPTYPTTPLIIDNCYLTISTTPCITNKLLPNHAPSYLTIYTVCRFWKAIKEIKNVIIPSSTSTLSKDTLTRACTVYSVFCDICDSIFVIKYCGKIHAHCTGTVVHCM